jgi:hypothetical protein
MVKRWVCSETMSCGHSDGAGLDDAGKYFLGPLCYDVMVSVREPNGCLVMPFQTLNEVLV